MQIQPDSQWISNKFLHESDLLGNFKYNFRNKLAIKFKLLQL